MATALFPPGSPDVLYLVDLSSYIFRAYHALAPLSSPAGEPTHAVYGTATMLERMVRERRPALMAVALDAGRVTFRTELYPDYKANRPPAPDDLVVQLERSEQLVRSWGLAVYKEPGVEADDLVACIVDRARDDGLRVVIVGADKDLMQLVGDDVVLWDTMRRRVFGVPEVEERFGVRVDQIRDWLALVGDASDNVPGVPSVGPKTATDLLRRFETLDGVYAKLDCIERQKLREALERHQDSARLSQKLVTLRRDCAISWSSQELAWRGWRVDDLQKLYTTLGFQSLLGRMRSLEPAPPKGPAGDTTTQVEATASPTTQVEVVDANKALATLQRLADETGPLAVAFAFEGSHAIERRMCGMAMSTVAGEAWYLPITDESLGNTVFAALSPLLARATTWDSKLLHASLQRQGIPSPLPSLDAGLASYLLEPDSRINLLELAGAELGMSIPELASNAGGRKAPKLAELATEELASHFSRSADALLQLGPELARRLDESGLARVHDELEVPLARVLARLEVDGVLVDVDCLSELSVGVAVEIAALEARIHAAAGKPFNVHSPRQLEALLFDELGLKPLKRTKTARSTDAATLESLAEEHEIPRLILEIRQLSKLKSTYLDALPQLVSGSTGRIHTIWEQTIAATGRLSSTEPNLQNIPVRTELGRRIRDAFVARPGHRILSADYSQIELRVLAHLSQDQVLLEAFRSGQDIHTRTAAEVFDVAPESVTPEMRRRAKAVNFGVIYGQGDSGLAKSLNIPRSEASQFIAAYFRRHVGVRDFMDATLESARAGEAVRSLLGRRRRVADIASGNRARRLAAERVAMNMPIQGTAADLLKLAMVALERPVTPGARMVMTVHDELVFEVPQGEVEDARARISEAMQGVYDLRVPLIVDVGVGANWHDAH